MKIGIQSIFKINQILGGRIEILVPEGANVRDFLSRMMETWGDKLSPYLFQPESNLLLPFIRLMVNGQVISYLNGMDTILYDGDEILILPLAAGG